MICLNVILISIVNNTMQKGYNTHMILYYVTSVYFSYFLES